VVVGTDVEPEALADGVVAVPQLPRIASLTMATLGAVARSWAVNGRPATSGMPMTEK